MALNLSALTVVRDVDVPRAQRGRQAHDNPLLSLVEESNTKRLAGDKSGMGLPNIPAEDVRECFNYLRYAANSLNIGMRIYAVTADNAEREVVLGRKEDENGNDTGLDIVYKDENTTGYTGPVNILFEAAKRREKKADETNGTASTETESVEDATAPDDEEDTENVTESAPETAETPAKPTRGRRTR